MVVSTFSILDKDSRMRFFEENFLLANIKPNIILKILFLTINNAKVDFKTQDLQQRSYITTKIFSTIKKIKLIEKKEFATAVLDPNYKIFVLYVAALNISFDIGDKVYPLQRAQIAYLKADKASTEIASKYVDFVLQNSPNT